MTALQRDLVHGVRLLRTDWALTLTATVILAIAIGANASVFSFVDTYLLRPLPYPDPDRLAIVTSVYPDGDRSPFQDGRTWERVRESAGAAYRTAAYSDGSTRVNLATGNSAISVLQQRVGAGYFSTLGVSPLAGRGFTAKEDVPGGPPVTILSHGLWQQLYDGDPEIIGATVALRGRPHAIVGVMPPGFRSSAQADLWVPLQPETTGEGQGANYHVLLRVMPHVTWAEAEARISTLGQTLVDDARPPGHFEGLSITSLQANDTSGLRDQLQVLWIAVGAVLLVSCVNVSGLLLVRSNRRQREIAIRLALGGNRGALARQMLVESLVLAVLGGAGGLLLASGLLEILKTLSQGVLDTWRPVSLDARVLAISGVATVFTALFFGLGPAFHASRVSLDETLRSGGRAFSKAGGLGRRLLVVIEVGLSVVLLVMAALLVRTFVHFQMMDPGFDPQDLAMFSVSLQDARYEGRADIVRLFEDGIQRVTALPGTIAAAAALGVPFERQLNSGFRAVDFEVADDGDRTINQTYVTPGYFETLDVPVLAGRPFEPSDGFDSASVTAVNLAFAQKYLGGERALHRRIRTANAERLIVGVVGNVKRATAWTGYEPIADIPTVYVPLSQLDDDYFQLVHTWFAPSWLVRFEGEPREVVPRIEAELASVDPLLPIASVRLATEVQRQSIADQRLVAVLVASLAVVSVFLAALGIWGLVASAVTEQRREIGIRMALGATPRTVVLLVAWPSVQLVASGAVLGIGGSLFATRALSSMLWGVSPSDPVSHVGVVATLLLTAMTASLIPASRAARLDPAVTLHDDC